MIDRRSFLAGTGGLLLASAIRPAAAATTTLKLVQSTHGLLFVPAMAAQELGIFEKRGLKAEFIVNLGGAEALAATLAGDADINVGAVSSAMRARERGTEVKIFGTSIARYASNLVVSADWAKKTGIDGSSSIDAKIAALKDARIAVIGIGSGTHQLVLYLAQRGKLNPTSDMEILGIGSIGSVLAAFQQGRIDAFVASSPSGEEAVRNHKGVMLINMSAGAIPELNDYPYVAFVTREAWLQKNPEIARAFMDGVNEALAVIHDPARGMEVRDMLYAKYHSKTDKALFGEAWATTLDAWPATAAVTTAMAKKAIGFLNQFSDEPYQETLVDSAFDYSLSKAS